MGTESGPAEDSVETIGRYEIVEELGKGAMGLVYKAVDPNIGRTVALKTMRLDVHGLEHDELLRRFRNEARAAGTLNHPNIVTIYDAGEDKGVFYIAMEFVEGRSLQALLNESRVIPVDQVLSISRQICAGLDYAHHHNVIHRDVKPANIMITADGTVKIMDFGIAKAGGGMTSTGQVLGTPNYMAPEQIKGKALDGRSDLFSVGVIVYEMLTGEKPFVGQNVTTIIYKICNEQPIPPRELDVSIHPGLSTVVTKALSKSPDERYQSGAEMVRELENYKAIGSDAGATQTFSTTMMSSMGDQTIVAAPGPVAAAPAPVLVPPRSPQTQASMQAAPNFTATAVSDSQPIPRIQETGSVPPPPTDSVRAKTRIPIYIGIGAVVLAVGSWLSIQNLRKHQVPVEQKLEEAQKAADVGMQIAKQAETLDKPSAAQPATPPPMPAIPVGAPSGELKITSDPSGATVQMDGQILPGLTPIYLPVVKPGSHSIVVTLQGYTSLARNFDLGAGKKKELEIQLKPEMGTVNVSTEPKGADVTVDGKSYGKTPAHFKLPVGEHTVTLTKDGFASREEKVTLTASQPVNLSRTLDATAAGSAATSQKGEANPFGKLKKLFGSGAHDDKGTLAITTKPDGAQVLINGSPALGVTPVRSPINSGKYKMTLRLDGYKTVEREITIEKGKTTGIDEILLPK